MKKRSDVKDWERFEIARVLGARTQPLLVRSTGIPDPGLQRQSLVILMLEEIGLRREEVNREQPERFRFTEREQAIVQGLAKGWTNKEIAAALGNTATTVREHIRNIMIKTNTSTRAGILGQVLQK